MVRLVGCGWTEPDPRLAAVRNEDVLARRDAFKPVSELVAERVRPYDDGCRLGGVELGGLEPPAS